jgi:hypothetical protein
MPDTTDLTKALDSYRAERGAFRDLVVPPQRYLALDGHGDPNTSQEFADAVGALYPVAYPLKFASKRELGRDYKVPPLEGLWTAADMATFTTALDKSSWDWTLLLLVPDWVGDDLVATVLDKARATKKLPRLDDVRLVTLTEGRCVQTLHVGSFDDEGPVLARLHDEVLPGLGLRPAGTHHEIYFSDVRKVEPAKLRTILRQPVAALGGATGSSAGAAS